MSPLTGGDGGSRCLVYDSCCRPRPFPLHQHYHREVNSSSRSDMTAWLSGAVWCVSVQWGQAPLCATVPHIVFVKRVFDLDKSLLAQFVPKISFLYSAWTLLLLFPLNSFWVRSDVMKPPPCRTVCYVPLLTLSRTPTFHVPADPRCSEKYKKWRTAQMVKNKDFPAAAAAAASPPPHILKLFFFSACFFFFFFLTVATCLSLPISHGHLLGPAL